MVVRCVGIDIGHMPRTAQFLLLSTGVMFFFTLNGFVVGASFPSWLFRVSGAGLTRMADPFHFSSPGRRRNASLKCCPSSNTAGI